MHLRRALAIFAALAIVAIAAAPTASAHKTTYSADGKIKIVWGFLNEPAVTWTKTGLDLILSDNATGAPITGAADTLEAHLIHGDDELHFENLRAQHGKAGSYTDVVTLTKPGVYVLKLHGTINGSAIDMEIPSQHETHGIEETYFPEVDSMDARLKALETEVATLKAQIKTQSETPATLTPQATAEGNDAPAAGVLLAALGAVAAALVLRRK
jgi:hypothetical protein